VIGIPTSASNLSCVGTDTGSDVVHILEDVECTINVNDDTGSILGFASDFEFANTTGGSNVGPPAVSGDGSQMTFTVTAPGTVGAIFNVLGRLEDGTGFDQGPFDLTVVGIVTVDSQISCAGYRSGNSFVRVNEDLLCIIVAKDGSGPTLALPGDFGNPRVVGGSLASALFYQTNNGSQIGINITSPSSIQSFDVTGKLADGSLFSEGRFELTVVGTPTTASTMNCVGLRSQTAFVRISELVVCEIVVKDAGGATTGVAEDFATPLVNGGTSLSPSSGVEYVEGGETMAFNMTSPNTVGASFNYTGRLADLSEFSEGTQTMTVVGTPTVDSQVSCSGFRSGNNIVRVNELVGCEITVRD
jgi:hypothetical protein